MNPADHYHRQFPAPSKDSSSLLNLNNPYHNHTISANISNFTCHTNHGSIGGGGISSSNNLQSNSITHPNNDTNINSSSGHLHATMGVQTPVYFAPSSFVVASHKSSQDLHDAMINAKKQVNSRAGVVHLLDFQELIGGGSETVSGINGAASEQVLTAKRPHIRFANGGQDYDPGPESARTAGDEMSIDYADHIDGGDCMDHLDGAGEMMKKGSRRLGYGQVKALEKAFEVENRLEPERKVRLASQLGLQPRQVAVWFQNRRARWKTKQMERDYILLKNKFDALKADRDKLLQEKENLQAELARLKGHPPPVEGMPGKKQDAKGEQDSPTLASSLLLDDAAPSPRTKRGKQGARTQKEEEQLEEVVEEKEEIGEDEALPPKQAIREQKLSQNGSLSSSEDSDINNDGVTLGSNSKAFQEEADYYSHQWRLPQAPTQVLYKPVSIKNEEWPEHGENMSSFNMHLDAAYWYNWGC